MYRYSQRACRFTFYMLLAQGKYYGLRLPFQEIKRLRLAQILVRCPWLVVFIKQWPEIGSLKAMLALFIETIDAGDKYACKDKIISTVVELS